jgi:glycine cleavage system transcriptional repressor
MKQFLVVSAIGENRPDTLHALTRAIKDCGCSVAESRMHLLGADFAMQALVTGAWNMLAKLESQLPKLEKDLGLRVSFHRTTEQPAREELIPYTVDVVCPDQPGILFNLTDFFLQRQIGVEEFSTHTYTAPHTGAPMFSVYIVVSIPTSVHIPMLREEFLDFCDHLNLDAILEPVKG